MHPTAVLHRAPWLLPVARPVISDGAVVLAGKRLFAVDRFTDLKVRYPEAAIVDHPDCVLMPGLVNAHIHLELSHLAHLAHQGKGKHFVDWLTVMLAERERLGAVGPHVEKAAGDAMQAQHDDGVVALADIGNTGVNCSLTYDFPGRLFPFVEYLGLGRKSLLPALKKLAQQDDAVFCTAHAPYSTHPRLICALKKRADRLGHTFPIHVAEPASETGLLSAGTGAIADFLKRRGFYEDVFHQEIFHQAPIDITGSVQYLHNLGVLNEKTLCVHGVHVSTDEIQLLAQSRAKVCLCPGSNRFLQVGKAPLPDYLAHGILPALGTDSAASNPELSIWREMRLLAEDHPVVDPFTILQMATIGGAQSLGIEQQYGTLAQGKAALLLCVSIGSSITGPMDLVEHLVHNGPGTGNKIQWLGVGGEEQ